MRMSQIGIQLEFYLGVGDDNVFDILPYTFDKRSLFN